MRPTDGFYWGFWDWQPLKPPFHRNHQKTFRFLNPIAADLRTMGRWVTGHGKNDGRYRPLYTGIPPF
jgi:hypothetical protein